MEPAFEFPPSVHLAYGDNRIAGLGLDVVRISGQNKAIIVTDEGVAKTGTIDRVVSILNKDGILTKVFSAIQSDPTASSIDALVAFCKSFGAKCLIAVGGGSPLDVAKTAAAIADADAPAEHYALCANPFPGSKSVKCIAIPTTSGTGAEVTNTAVFTNAAGHKVWAWGDELTAEMALLEPRLTLSLPPHLTAATGMDALVHAIESYVGGDTPIIIDGMAIPAIKAIMKWLPVAYADGANTAARENMHLAATMAMAACTNSYGSLNHDMAHQLGSYYHLTHGVANAIMLGYFLAWLYAYNPERLAMLAKELGLDVKNTRDGAQKLIAAMGELRKKVGLPGSLKEARIEESKLMTDLDNLAQATLDSGVSQQRPTLEEVKDIFIKAWEGAEPALPPE